MTLQGGSSNMELKLKQFKDTLIKAVNEAELPLSLVSYVMKELLQDVEEVRSHQLHKNWLKPQKLKLKRKLKL